MINQYKELKVKNTLLLSDWSEKIVTLISGNDVKCGQVLGEIKASSKIAKMVSTASDGSQYPVGIALEDVDASSGDLPIRMLILGTVNANDLIFNGSDTLAIFPGSSNYNYDKLLQMLGIYTKSTQSI